MFFKRCALAAVLLGLCLSACSPTVQPVARAAGASTPPPLLTPSGTPAPLPSATFTPSPSPTPTIQTTISPKDGMEIILIPAGNFLMGVTEDEARLILAGCPSCAPDALDHEKPQHTVYLDDYWIDRTEVTNAMFRKFVQETGLLTAAEKNGIGLFVSPNYENTTSLSNPNANWQHPTGGDSIEGKGDHPVVQVTREEARAYCEWAGRMLPSEAQWEKAARGTTDARRYPWGNQPPDATRLNFADASSHIAPKTMTIDDGFRRTAPVGSFPAGASPYGALDMLGNVQEWVMDGTRVYTTEQQKNPLDTDIDVIYTARGFSFSGQLPSMRITRRSQGISRNTYDTIGFRCALSTGEQAAAQQSMSYRITMDNANHLENIQSLDLPGISALALSPDKSRLAVAHLNGINIYDFESLTLQLAIPADSVLSVDWSPDGKQLVSGGWPKSLDVWDALSGDLRYSQPVKDVPAVVWVDWSPDGRTIAVGEDRPYVDLFDTASRQWFNKLSISGRALCGQFSPDGKYLAAGTNLKDINVFTTSVWNLAYHFSVEKDWVTALQWSPNSKRLAASDDYIVNVYDVEGQQRLYQWSGWMNDIVSLAWSPAGDVIAAGSSTTTLTLWGVGAERSEFRMKGFENGVYVVWSPNGKRLVTGSGKGKLQLWVVKGSGGSQQSAAPKNLLKAKNGIFLTTSFEDLSPEQPNTITPFIFDQKTYSSMAAMPSLAQFKPDHRANLGGVSINVIPNGNPVTTSSRVVSAARLNPVFEVTGLKRAYLQFVQYSTSNPDPGSVHNCGSSLNVYYRLDGGKWQHRMAFCGAYPGESRWNVESLPFDLKNNTTIEFAFEYEVQGVTTPNPDAFFLIDDLVVQGE